MRRNLRTPSSANADSGEGLALMLKPQRGICCAGCPHRAAYVVVKDVIRRGRGHVICGEAGCPAVGHVHPAATACPGGQAELMSMYNKPVPQGTPEEPGSVVCAHFVLDADVAADDGTRFGAEQLAGEGACAILCVMASSKVFLSDGAVTDLGRHLQRLGYSSIALADPLDTAGTGDMLRELVEAGGVHALVFASPCAQLQRTAILAPAEVERVSCVGCMRCVQITACPALSFRPPAAFIDPDACAGCDLCSDYCRTRVILTPRADMTPAQRHAERLAAAGA